MKYLTIPGTELRPSVICLGTGSFGSAVSAENAYSMLERFTELGGTFIDTAKVYADWMCEEKSISEKTIGRWMKQRGNRGRIILGTKGAHPELDKKDTPRLSPEEIVSDLQMSLRHLQTDYIDLYWLHRDDPSRSVAEIIDILNEQVRLGTIRYFGCSNWRSERIEEANRYAASKGLQGFAANQPGWSLADSPAPADPTMVFMDKKEKQYHERTGLTAVPYNSQASGFFSGRYHRDNLAARTPENRKVWKFCSESNLQKLQRVQQIAAEIGISGSQAAIAYLLSQSFPVCPVIGSKTLEQLEDSCAAGDLTLNEKTVAILERTM